MAQIIHAKKDRRTKKFVFRIWDTVSNLYLTEELSEKKLRKLLGEEAIKEVMAQYSANIDARIKRARNTGTSMVGGISREIGKWEKGWN
jgi:hypothetical protein